MPVTAAAPGAWQIGSIGSNSPWAVPGTFSAHCPPLLLPLSWIKPLFPALHHLLLSLFCFTSPHSLLPIFPSRLPLKERDLNANLSRSPTLTTTTTPPRSIPPRLPPRSSSEAAKASITPSLATDDPGKIFFVLSFGICRKGGSCRLGLLHHDTRFCLDACRRHWSDRSTCVETEYTRKWLFPIMQRLDDGFGKHQSITFPRREHAWPSTTRAAPKITRDKQPKHQLFSPLCHDRSHPSQLSNTFQQSIENIVSFWTGFPEILPPP